MIRAWASNFAPIIRKVAGPHRASRPIDPVSSIVCSASPTSTLHFLRRTDRLRFERHRSHGGLINPTRRELLGMRSRDLEALRSACEATNGLLHSHLTTRDLNPPSLSGYTCCAPSHCDG